MYEMHDEDNIDVGHARPGDKVAVWGLRGRDRGCGQGGTVLELTDYELVIASPVSVHRYPVWQFDAGIYECNRERVVPLSECIEFEEGVCSGKPRPFSPRGIGGPIRCEFHVTQRMERYENSIERYADSATPPAWFDPAYAGESWDETY